MGAADVELTADDLREIERTASQIQVQGARLPESILRMTGFRQDRAEEVGSHPTSSAAFSVLRSQATSGRATIPFTATSAPA